MVREPQGVCSCSCTVLYFSFHDIAEFNRGDLGHRSKNCALGGGGLKGISRSKLKGKGYPPVLFFEGKKTEV